MCEFCHKHGEGKKWYLQAENYSEDLLSDVRRQSFLREFFSKGDEAFPPEEQFEKLHRAPPLVQKAIRRAATARAKKEHFGQVVPLEDVARIFEFTNSIVRVPCICRHATLGKDVRYCYGIALDPHSDAWRKALGNVDSSFLAGPDVEAHEQLTAAEALQAFADHEKEGLCHTVWTFVTPFIGGLCNCDRADCMAMKATVTHDIKVMFRAEYVASVSPDACVGCRSCMRLCQFGALGYSASTKKVFVDQRACYGCGVCRAGCAKQAISLSSRAEVPGVAEMW